MRKNAQKIEKFSKILTKLKKQFTKIAQITAKFFVDFSQKENLWLTWITEPISLDLGSKPHTHNT